MKIFSIISILERRISSSYVKENKSNQYAGRKQNRKSFTTSVTFFKSEVTFKWEYKEICTLQVWLHNDLKQTWSCKCSINWDWTFVGIYVLPKQKLYVVVHGDVVINKGLNELCKQKGWNPMNKVQYKLLPPFQIIRRFSIYRYITFAMHLDIHYV